MGYKWKRDFQFLLNGPFAQLSKSIFGTYKVSVI